MCLGGWVVGCAASVRTNRGSLVCDCTLFVYVFVVQTLYTYV